MATNKKSNTSKTARVMNLLSKNREEPLEPELTAAEDQDKQPAPIGATAPATAPAAAPAASEAASEPASEAAAPAAPTPAAHPSTPPIISSMQADSAISNQVLSALESALDDELRDSLAVEAPAASVDTPVTETVPAPAVEEAVPAPVKEEPVPAPVATADPVNDAVAEAITQITEAEEAVVEAAEASVIQLTENETAPSAENKSKKDDEPHPPTRFNVDKSTIYVNVMESLVEDRATKYINLFGLCKCPRCVADVKAYALNHLEPKYVVMQTGDVIPRITLYESQYAANVTAQLLTACKLVMEHPRHDR